MIMVKVNDHGTGWDSVGQCPGLFIVPLSPPYRGQRRDNEQRPPLHPSYKKGGNR